MDTRITSQGIRRVESIKGELETENDPVKRQMLLATLNSLNRVLFLQRRRRMEV